METTGTVREVLERKGGQIWWIRPDAWVYEALELMAEKNIGAVLVLEHGDLVGILSERDYARKVILMGRLSRNTRVREIMSEHVVGVAPDQTLGECMALMSDKRVRHLPVVDEGHLVGIISISDVVRAIISEQEFVIQKLQELVGGHYP